MSDNDIKFNLSNAYQKLYIALDRGYEASDLEWDMDLGTYLAIKDYATNYMTIYSDDAKSPTLFGVPIKYRSHCEQHLNLTII